MSNSYAAVSALIFALVAVGHVLRLANRWTVQIGPYNVSMNVSWAALVNLCPDRNLGLHAIRLMPQQRPLRAPATSGGDGRPLWCLDLASFCQQP